MNASSSVWGALLALIVIAMLGYGIIKVRRAREAHRARSDERAAEMLLTMHRESARRNPDPITPTPKAAPSPAPRPAPAAQPAALQRKTRLLDDNQRLLYLVLRSALGDCVIMTHIRIADLVHPQAGPSSAEREAKLKLLLQERIDCIVCNNDLAPLAAVMIYDGATGVTDDRIKAEVLRELGLRFLRFRTDNLPKPNEMRGLVLG